MFSFRTDKTGRVVRWLLVISFFAVLIYYTSPRPKSFAVNASTEYLKVDTVDTRSPDWELPVIEGCLRLRDGQNSDAFSLGTPAYADCASSRYAPFRIYDPVLRWTDGYTLRLYGEDLETARIVVTKLEDARDVRIDGFDGLFEAGQRGPNPISIEIQDRSILVVPWIDSELQERVVLPMRGRIDIGDLPNAPDSLFLRSGRYEIRQDLGLNPRPVVVGRGDLFAGDVIGFERRAAPFWVKMSRRSNPSQNHERDIVSDIFVSDLSRFTPAFDLVATTPQAFGDLRLTRLGTGPTLIPVTWTDRLRADAIPAGVSALIGLLSAFLALTNTYFKVPDKAVSRGPAIRSGTGRRRKHRRR